MIMETTSFGTLTLNPDTAASWLRAKAAKEGVELKKARKVDLLSSVISAEAYLFITKGDLNHPRQYGPASVAVLAAILSRASGNSLNPPADFIHNQYFYKIEENIESLRKIEEIHRLAEVIYKANVKEAFEISAYDLYAAFDKERAEPYINFAYLLQLYADNL